MQAYFYGIVQNSVFLGVVLYEACHIGYTWPWYSLILPILSFRSLNISLSMTMSHLTLNEESASKKWIKYVLISPYFLTIFLVARMLVATDCGMCLP